MDRARGYHTSIGMTAEQMGKLFQEFYQVSSTTASKYGGTGLGIVISKRFCQLMGGDIMVESKFGRGSTFTIRVPRDRASSKGRSGGLQSTPSTRARSLAPWITVPAVTYNHS